MVEVLYPGTFDPVHIGHLDIVKRAAKLFDKIYVAVAENKPKKPLFTLEERVKLFREAVEDLGLSDKVKTVLRGVRLFTDFEYELQISLTNFKLGGVETLFMMPSQELIHISSTIVKDIAKHGGCLKNLVPKNVEEALRKKFNLC